jgi:hypothetical protein
MKSDAKLVAAESRQFNSGVLGGGRTAMCPSGMPPLTQSRLSRGWSRQVSPSPALFRNNLFVRGRSALPSATLCEICGCPLRRIRAELRPAQGNSRQKICGRNTIIVSQSSARPVKGCQAPSRPVKRDQLGLRKICSLKTSVSTLSRHRGVRGFRAIQKSGGSGRFPTAADRFYHLGNPIRFNVLMQRLTQPLTHNTLSSNEHCH